MLRCEGSYSAGPRCVLNTIDDQSDTIHQLNNTDEHKVIQVLNSGQNPIYRAAQYF